MFPKYGSLQRPRGISPRAQLRQKQQRPGLTSPTLTQQNCSKHAELVTRSNQQRLKEEQTNEYVSIEKVILTQRVSEKEAYQRQDDAKF